MRIRALAFSIALTAGLAGAQCPFSSVSSSTYGPGCSAVFPGNLPTLSVALDVPGCSLGVTVTAFGGCCNTFLVGRLLALGDAPTMVPLPQLGAGCVLQVDQPILLYQPSAAGDTFVLPVGAALPPLTVYAQGAALYFTTIGFSTDLALTGGYQVQLS